MATPLIAGIAVAAAAYAGRYSIQAWQAFKARPPRLRKFYEGGFQPTMTKREAALILGVRCPVQFTCTSTNPGAQSHHPLAGNPIKAGAIAPCGLAPKELIAPMRESTPADKIKEAHRRVMVANHPDAGGSHYLASKINEAKDMILGKTKGSGSAF
ncbi:hypothetical protein RHMOL_Rhmol05G0249000 [Rhododendron molle]|uniref:Uncharacterized protein n=1 Tax=Rhododendron molle TaxID=49168 RepID=A0ACC0NTZ2_RHOML|nr:hypothetical protein RHMOL_Rhmol05G0249000 [Rhododendron molle]